jgi:hypothetical protein
MVKHLLYYSCYNAPTCFDATVPSSGGSFPVPAKLHKHFNAELVIFLKKITFVLLLKCKIIAVLRCFIYNKIILLWNSYVILSRVI